MFHCLASTYDWFMSGAPQPTIGDTNTINTWAEPRNANGLTKMFDLMPNHHFL
jgi:hypothetical protein